MRLIPAILVLIGISIIIPAYAETISCEDVFPNIKYTITDGKIGSCAINEATKSLVLKFDSKSEGQVFIKIPKKSQLDPCNDSELIVVLLDGEEADFKDSKSAFARTVLVTVPSGRTNSEIEVITAFIPGTPPKLENCITKKSPKQQAISGVILDKTVCNRDFVLIEKETDHSAACVSPSTAKSLVDRGWGQYVFYSGSFDISEQNVMYAVDYKIRNGIVNDIVADFNAESLIVYLTQTRDGEIIIKIPRAVIDARLGPDGESGMDDTFFVLVDGKEVKFTEKREESFRELTIPLVTNAKQIEIIGTNVSFQAPP